MVLFVSNQVCNVGKCIKFGLGTVRVKVYCCTHEMKNLCENGYKDSLL